jgi:hypothetical protein
VISTFAICLPFEVLCGSVALVVCIGNSFCTTGGEDEGDVSSMGLLLSEEKYFLADARFDGLSSSSEELKSCKGKVAPVT